MCNKCNILKSRHIVFILKDQARFKHNTTSSTDSIHLQTTSDQGDKSSQQQGEDRPTESCGPTETSESEGRKHAHFSSLTFFRLSILCSVFTK